MGFIDDYECLSGSTIGSCGAHVFIVLLMIAQSISSLVLFYFLATYARKYYLSPTKANKNMIFLVLPGLFYSVSNALLCFFPYYEDSVQYLYSVSSNLKCFTYVVAIDQAIFLIRLISTKYASLLRFVMFFTMAFIIIELCIVLIRSMTPIKQFDDHFLQFCSIVIETYTISLYTFTCTVGFVISDQTEWVLSPSYCKAMKYVIFINSFLHFFYIILNVTDDFGDSTTIFYVYYVVYHFGTEKRRSISLFLVFLKTFVTGNLPVLITVVAMLFMKPTNQDPLDENTDAYSGHTSMSFLHEKLLEPSA